MTDPYAQWTPPPTPPPIEQEAPPPNSRNRRWFVPILVALLVGLGAGFGIGHTTTKSSSSPAKVPTSTAKSTAKVPAGKISVNGTLSLDNSSTDALAGDANFITVGTTCIGSSGYDDIAAGAEVVISDDTGATLSITQLNGGSVDSATGSCDFTFSALVPKKDFYGITVTHRGTVKFSQSDMAAGPALSIGS